MRKTHRNAARILSAPLAAALLLSSCISESPVDSGDRMELDGPRLGTVQSPEATYVLTASKWNARQTRAVEAAGGSVLWSHAGTGIAAVTSDDPDFLESALDSRAFSGAAMDQMVEWQPQVRSLTMDEAGVTPGDEGFFGLQWNMQAIDAPAAWATGSDGTGARVAVIDGGINDSHLDLSGQVDAACSASFVPGVPFNQDVGGFWHGTHVAGIVAAADNALGVVGVAPGATIMGAKALHDGSGFFSWIIGAILFTSDPTSFPGFAGCERADVINMSLGAAFFRHQVPGLVGPLNRAVNFAGSKGVLVISAAGNNGLDFGQLRDATIVPAESGNGLAIAATGPTGFISGSTNFRRFASYSNWGESLVTLAAPGGDFVFAPGFPFDMVLSPCGGLGGTFYCFAAGTSMASPAAAGVAALIVGNNPGISLGKLKNVLKSAADDEGERGNDEFYGDGFVNAFNAVSN